MKKMLLTLCLCLLTTSSSLAVMSTTENTMGLYWDLSADTVCIEGVSVTNDLYLIFTNPTMETIIGFGAGVDMEGEGMILDEIFANAGIINLVDGPMEYQIFFTSPTICTEATLLVTISVLKISWDWEGGLYFYLRGPDDPFEPNGVPEVTYGYDTELAVETSTEPGTVNAYIGLECGVVATEKTTWDSVKSMYR